MCVYKKCYIHLPHLLVRSYVKIQNKKKHPISWNIISFHIHPISSLLPSPPKNLSTLSPPPPARSKSPENATAEQAVPATEPRPMRRNLWQTQPSASALRLETNQPTNHQPWGFLGCKVGDSPINGNHRGFWEVRWEIQRAIVWRWCFFRKQRKPRKKWWETPVKRVVFLFFDTKWWVNRHGIILPSNTYRLRLSLKNVGEMESIPMEPYRYPQH